MIRTVTILSLIIAALAWAAPAHALVTFYAEGPVSASVGAEFPIRVKARITDAINALATTVQVSPDTVEVVRFDDTDSAVRLWLERGTAVPGGVRLQGVIPGGIGPAFTDVIEVGTLWVKPTTAADIRLSFADAEVYLNQPTPTRDTVKLLTLTIRPGPARGDGERLTDEPFITDRDVRVVRESELNDGKRTLVFDIKTDRGTVDVVRMRERWLGIVGSWRDASSSSTLSDAWGLSILEVALPETMGGAHVASIVPTPLIVLWILIALMVGGAVIRWRLRHR